MTKTADATHTNEVDANRARRLDAIRVLDELLTRLSSAGYTGSGRIEIHAHNGALKQIKSGIERFH